MQKSQMMLNQMIKTDKTISNSILFSPKKADAKTHRLLIYNWILFFFSSSLAVSTESTPVLFLTGANSLSRSTS